MGPDDAFRELPAVSDETSMVIRGLGPVGALHQLDVESIHSTRIPERRLANRLAIIRAETHDDAPASAAADWPATRPIVTQLPYEFPLPT